MAPIPPDGSFVEHSLRGASDAYGCGRGVGPERHRVGAEIERGDGRGPSAPDRYRDRGEGTERGSLDAPGCGVAARGVPGPTGIPRLRRTSRPHSEA